MRNSVAIVLGIIVGGITATLIGMIPVAMYGDEPIDPKNIEAVKSFFRSLPAIAFVILLVGHGVGSFVAAGITTLVGESIRWIPTAVISLFFVLMSLGYWAAYPFPSWFVVLDLLVFPAMGFSGEWTARRLKGQTMFGHAGVENNSFGRTEADDFEHEAPVESETEDHHV